MADEIPPAPSETEDASKAETIRITLPPRQEQQAIKRETVRISLPGKPAGIPSAGIAPKKETTKLGGLAGAETARMVPSAAEGDMDASATVAKPFTPPTPPSAPSVPPAKPAPGMAPPKPPAFGARPTVPLKPAPSAPAAPAAPAAAAAAPAPIAQKAAAPKKETARITLPPEGAAKPALPKATVKMQQTQPLVNRPAPSLTPASPVQTAPLSAAHHAMPAEADSTQNIMSIAALVVSLLSLIFVFLAYNAAS